MQPPGPRGACKTAQETGAKNPDICGRTKILENGTLDAWYHASAVNFFARSFLKNPHFKNMS